MRLLLLAVLLPAAAFAQTTGSLSGTVVDERGEALPGATLFMPQIQRGAATDIDGAYRIDSIPAGTFEVQVASVGFETQTFESVQVFADRVRRLDAGLSIGTDFDGFIGCNYDPKGPILSASIYSPRRLQNWELLNRPDRY